MNFISRTNLEMHTEYLRGLKLKMSIFEKSYPQMQGKSCRELLRLPLPRTEREAAAALKAEVLAHELYFSSFSSPNLRSSRVHAAYGSEADFIYRLATAAADADGFLFVSLDRRGKPVWQACREPLTPYISSTAPLLALDLYEHAYFYDYAFDKQAYIRAALAHVDLSRLE